MTNDRRFDRRDIHAVMSSFRRGLREGKVRVTRLPGIEFEVALRREVASQFGIKPTDFNTEYFAPATLKRLADFFSYPRKFDEETGSSKLPTQDEIAWAVQNFINRRKSPWNKFAGEVVLAAMVPEDAMVVHSEEESADEYEDNDVERATGGDGYHYK